MSRIGRRLIPVPNGVEVTVAGSDVTVKGPKGELNQTLVDPISITKHDDGTIELVRPDDERRSRAMHGLCRSLVANMVEGVSEGFTRSLEINGTGYRVQLKGANLEFALGFSHPVVVEPPEGVTFRVEKPTVFHVEGIDKQVVGEIAANIRKIRPPEPYKGKGVKYVGEHIRRKAGKAGK